MKEKEEESGPRLAQNPPSTRNSNREPWLAPRATAQCNATAHDGPPAYVNTEGPVKVSMKRRKKGKKLLSFRRDYLSFFDIFDVI